MSNRLYNQFMYSPERQPISLQGSFTQVGAAGDRASLDAGTAAAITFYAQEFGSAGNSIQLTFINTGGTNPISVAVTGNSIVVTLASTAGTITSDTNALEAAIIASAAASALVYTNINDVSLVPAMTITNLAGGADTTFSSMAMNMTLIQIDTGLFKIQLEDTFPNVLFAAASLMSEDISELSTQIVSTDTTHLGDKSVTIRTLVMQTAIETNMADGDTLFIHLILRNSSN